MSNPSIGPKPYLNLGKQLKSFRINHKESIEEVSGSIEINPNQLERYEAGLDRPDEEILELLISHYHVHYSVSEELYKLAGYDSYEVQDEYIDFNTPESLIEATQIAKQIMFVFASENKAQYTDGLRVDFNQHGLQLTFTQSQGGSENQIVTKLGMSNEMADNVIKTLTLALLYSKFLPRQPLIRHKPNNS